MKKIFCTLFLLLTFSFVTFADDYVTIDTLESSLASILPEGISDQLLKATDDSGCGKLSRMLYGAKDMKPTYMPKTELSKTVFDTWKNEKTVFMIETLYLYKKSDEKSGKIDAKALSDILHSVSTLQGIEYYSTSRGTMRLLYEVSSAVKAVQSGKKVTYEKIADDLTASEQLVMQKDLTFGEYIYKYSYFNEGNAVSFVCENTQKLKYGIFSLVDPYNLNVSLTIIDLGDYLLAYANTRGNFLKLLGIEKKLKNSFSTRADAVYDWFIKSYEK